MAFNALADGFTCGAAACAVAGLVCPTAGAIGRARTIASAVVVMSFMATGLS